MKTMVEYEYRVSPRRTLRPGDKFRVGRGPYYICRDGERFSVADRGVMQFCFATRRGRVVMIHAVQGGRSHMLHISGRRKNREIPGLVCRPYTVRPVATRRKAVSR